MDNDKLNANFANNYNSASTVNQTFTNASVAPPDYTNCCPNRLPCGYCRLMCGMCPLQTHTTITWTNGNTATATSEMFKIHPESVTYTTTTAEVNK